MTVRNSLLAILAEQPTHGYGLKSSFERNTAGLWPLNVGQVYTTLGRLERDGFVKPWGKVTERARQSWKITAAGRKTLTDWFESPVEDRPRDELAIKVLLAIAADSVDVREIIHRQRVATMERLQQLTRAKRKTDPKDDLSTVLLLDLQILRADSEIKWLDVCEQRLRGRRRRDTL